MSTVERQKELDDKVRKGMKHLKEVCPVMSELITRCNKPELLIIEDHFYYFCRSITYQQLSGKAALSIFGRFEELVSGTFTPKKILNLEIEDMRSAGLSYSKAAYIKNVAEFWMKQPKLVKDLSSLPDDELLRHLTSIKGVGVWTVQMFMMFADGRTDILPTGDLAIRKALVYEYGLPEKAKKADYENVSSPWMPYRTVASWYLWRSLEK